MQSIFKQFFGLLKDEAENFMPFIDEDPDFEEMFFNIFNEDNPKANEWFYKNEKEIEKYFWRNVSKRTKESRDIEETRHYLAVTMHSF